MEQEIDYDFVNHENIIQIEDQATEKQYLFESSTPIEIIKVDLSDLKKKENSGIRKGDVPEISDILPPICLF